MLIIAAVIDILARIGIINPPQWLVDAILVAATVTVIIAILESFGLASVPLWAAKALLAADTVAL